MASCIICLDNYSDKNKPIIFNCGHTFCDSCQKKIQKNNSNKKICPTCRKVIEDSFINYSLLELVDLQQNKIPDFLNNVAMHLETIEFSFKKIKFNLKQSDSEFTFEFIDEFGIMLTYPSFNPFTIGLMEKGKISLNSENWSNLMLVSASGNVELVKYILNKKTDVNYLSNDGYTALIVACQNIRHKNTKEIMNLLIEFGADVNKTSSSYKLTAIMFCLDEMINIENICSNDFEIVKILLENNADLALKSFVEETTLVFACRLKNLEIVKMLIDYGADPNQNCGNNIALSTLFDNSLYDFIEISELIFYLVSISDLSIRFIYGDTLLMKAIESGNETISEILLMNGVDIHVENSYGNNTFYYVTQAYCMNHISQHFVEKIFAFGGIDINKRNASGITCLNCAIMTLCQFENADNLWIIHFLIENGANFNIPCNKGYSPLLFVNRYLRNNKRECIEKIAINLENAIRQRNLILYPIENNDSSSNFSDDSDDSDVDELLPIVYINSDE